MGITDQFGDMGEDRIPVGFQGGVIGVGIHVAEGFEVADEGGAVGEDQCDAVFTVAFRWQDGSGDAEVFEKGRRIRKAQDKCF